jgi:hypothetical protein
LVVRVHVLSDAPEIQPLYVVCRRRIGIAVIRGV